MGSHPNTESMKKRDNLTDTTYESSSDHTPDMSSGEVENDGVAAKKGFRRLLNPHFLFLLILLLLFGFLFYRLSNWGIKVDLDEIFKDGPGTYEDTFDSVLPLLDENFQPVDQEESSVILAFGNAPFADDRDSENSLAAMIEDLTGATVYNCAVSGSYLASQNPSFDAKIAPMDAYCFYWLVHLAMGSPIEYFYSDAKERLTAMDAYPEDADEVYETLTTLDLNTVDTVVIMYDGTDYLMGHAMYSDENTTDIQQFTGNLEAGIELLQKVYPQIRIIVMSPTYAYAVDKAGNYVSSDQYIYNNRDVLSTYVIKQSGSCADRGVSFVDHLYGTITEDNAKKYLIDNVHLNEDGRRAVAERFEYFLNYYIKGYGQEN